MQEVAEFERLCFELYESGDPARVAEAHKVLHALDEDPSCIPRCRAVIEFSEMSSAQFLAAMTITSHTSKLTTTLLPLDNLELRNFALNCLAAKSYSHIVVLQLSKMIARLTKLCWFECDSQDRAYMQDIMQHINRFLSQGSPQFSRISAQIMLQLVMEMDQPDSVQGVSRHRKISTSFRDTCLLTIFQTSISSIRQVSQAKDADFDFLAIALQVSRACLNYDHIGVSADESTEDFRTVQIPASWRDTLADPQTLQLFFSVYLNTGPPISEYALGCLVHLASVRRTLFSNAQRMDYLTALLRGIVEIVRTSQGLDHQENFHECCRILARLKANYQLAELVKVPEYSQKMDVVANFTVACLNQWYWSPNSVHYVLSLWERLIASVPFVRTENPHQLEEYSPRISRAFILSKYESARLCLEDAAQDPLDDPETFEAELAQFSVIARFQYQDTLTTVFGLFEPAVQAYIASLGILDPSSIDFKVIETQLVWLLYIVGALIGGKSGSSSGDDEDNIDGDLTCKILQIISAVDNQVAVTNAPRSELIDAAFIYFFQQFRITYIGDQVHKSIKIYTRLEASLGLKDDTMLLSVFARKIVDSLEYWNKSKKIIEVSLKLLSDLCTGYTSMRKLIGIEAIQFILAHHSEFRFLNEVEDTRHRTIFYTAIGKLLTPDASEDQGRFEEFMAPFAATFRAVTTELARVSTENIHRIKHAVVGLARDLRGIVQTCSSKASYTLFFEWIYPDHLPILSRAMELCYDDPLASVPILKFMNEFVQNKNNRLNFGVSSPHGILLFRETSKLLSEYGSRACALAISDPEQLYPQKYKGVAVCYNIFRQALCGDYVNFGVFQLYGDSALDVAFDTFFKLLVSTPMSDLMIYPKLNKAFFQLLGIVARDHMRYLAQLDANTFSFVCATIFEGLRYADTGIASACCSTLDSILTFALVGRNKPRPDVVAVSLFNLIGATRAIFTQMLKDLLGTVIFEDCKHQWSVSRPLLGLIVVLPAEFLEEQQRVIGTQPAFRQGLFAEAFVALMDGVGDSLSAKNRDLFTQNLAVFRRDISNQPKSAAPAPVTYEAMDRNDSSDYY